MRCSWRVVLAVSVLASGALVTVARGQETPTDVPSERIQVQPPTGAADPRESICLMVESAARVNDLPVEFFARVIWQESRFAPDAVGPRTRSGERALGIAQFMPGTAAERRLLDPFDPVQALPKSAEFLRELRDQFGNLGLAAAAYNAGPQRLRDFLAGTRMLPAETRNYVVAITGTSVDEWAKGAKDGVARDGTRGRSVGPNCRELIALLRRAPNPFVEQLEQRVKLVAASAWGVQLSAGFSRDRALAAFAGLARRYGEILAGHDPTILSTTLRSRGTRPFYQVRLGADTRASADSLCGKIRRAGGACLVLRNAGAAS
jgi:Transglycosylase SLT domain/SPOR domain